MLDTPTVPISPQWEAAWRSFERAHYHQSNSAIRNRRASVHALARWLARPENGAITDPDQVTRSDLTAYMSVMENVREGGGVIVLYAELRVFFRWYAGEFKGCDQCADPAMFRYHGCRQNAMYGVRRPSPAKHKSRVVPVIEPDQAASLLAAVGGRDFRSVRDRALIMLLLDSGVRRAEALALDVSDLDLSRRGGGTVHVRDGKNHNDRHAVVGPETALALDRLLRAHPLNPGTGSTWDGPLFTTTTGRGISPQLVGVIIARAGNAAGIEMPDGRQLHPHQLRHTWADAHYAAGTPESAMKQLGGWRGKIPDTYAQSTKDARAVALGLQRPVLDMIKDRGKKRNG